MKLSTTNPRTENPNTPRSTRTMADRFARHARSTMGPKSDEAAGRGMDLALTVTLFLVIGVLLDRWLGTSPIFTIVLLAAASVGSFFGMKSRYDAAMDLHQADLAQRRRGQSASVNAGPVKSAPATGETSSVASTASGTAGDDA